MPRSVRDLLECDNSIIDVLKEFKDCITELEQDIFDEIYFNMNTSAFRLPLFMHLLESGNPAAQIDVCEILGSIRNVHGRSIFNQIRCWLTGENIADLPVVPGVGPKRVYICDNRPNGDIPMFSKHIASPFKINEESGPDNEQQIIIRSEDPSIIKSLETGFNDMGALMQRPNQRRDAYVISATRNAKDIINYARLLISDGDFEYAHRKIILYPSGPHATEVLDTILMEEDFTRVFIAS